MKLRELIADVEQVALEGDAEIEIAGLSYDSRETRPGDLFFALARDASQNRANLNEALSRGARAVVVMRGGGAHRTVQDMAARPAAIVGHERPRLLMAAAASRFHGAPSERLDLIGVTGTSGKTTTTYILASIFEAEGASAGIIGTVGTFVAGKKIKSGLTTPESIDFEAALAEMECAGVRRVAAEISSIGIEERRVERLNFRACVFTNLGRDHLEYHHTIEEYFAAKLRLFTELLPRSRRVGAAAIVRGDDPFGRRVLDSVAGRKLSFGMSPELDVHPIRWEAGLGGIRASIRALNQTIEIESPLLGSINLLNILGAAAVSMALGIEGQAVAAGVRRCPGAPGRVELVAGPDGVTVVVDYAHKPDALAAVLGTLRALNPRRVICVFGCGGDRDRGKRPIMGEISGRLADLTIVTSDNPRSEDPNAIIGEIESGLAGLTRLDRADESSRDAYLIEPDRRAAIGIALRIALPRDIVIIAGKGHEDYQIIGARRLHFDDREVVREITGASRS